MQSKLDSFVEAWINVFIGFWINFAGNLLILPLVGFNPTIHDNLIIGLCFTVISVTRTYVIRRWAQEHLTRLRVRIVGYLKGLVTA